MDLVLGVYRYAFIAPPHAPIHAHCVVGHMGGDHDNEPMWQAKNAICGRAGENNAEKYGTGRFMSTYDTENQIFGHAPAQEPLV